MSTPDAPARPRLLQPVPDGIPASLRAERRWVIWQLERREERWTKVPYQPTGQRALSTSRSTWSSFDAVLAGCKAGSFDGIGFVLGDGYFGLDLDHVVDPGTGQLPEEMEAVLLELGTYAELSVSGSGAHAIVRGMLPPGTRRRGNVELYDAGRYFTVTGHRLALAPGEVRDCADVLGEVYARLFPPSREESSANRWQEHARSGMAGEDDEALLGRARNAANGANFAALYDRGDTSGHAGDDSAADLTLATMLTWWCEGDTLRADRLFRRSALMRPKWTARHAGDGRSYGELTFGRALATWRKGERLHGEKRAGTSPVSSEPGWPEPGALPNESGTAPELPPELIPGVLRPWLVETADRLSVPLEYVAVPALVALGAVTGRGLAIAPLEKSDWIVTPNLWGAVVGPPGWLKSPALAEALRPVNRLAAEAREAFEAERARFEAEAELLEVRLGAAREKVKSAPKRGEEAFLDELAQLKACQAELQSTKSERRYLTHDATVEKLGELLRQNRRGLLIMRDELAGWLMTLEREGRQGEREFFLEAWSGTGRYDFDRIGRGSVPVESLTLGIVGGIQPGKLNRWIAGAMAGEDGADGLVQRFGLIAYPDELGTYRKPERWPDGEARRAATLAYDALAHLDAEALGAEVDDRGIPFVRFAPRAQAAWDE